MIGDLFNNNKRKDVCTREGQRFYKGVKYSVEKGTGYLVATTGERRRLHVVMYECEHGVVIPEGYVIHHLDGDKTHNVIENLVCISVEEHEWIHNRKDKTDKSKKIVDFFDKRVVKYN